jgi:ADP-ribose pyrophosphatase
MDKIPFVKREVSNKESQLDWKYGNQESNIALENQELNVQILRYHIISPDGKVLYDTIGIKESKTNSVTVIKNENNEIGLVKEWRPVPAKWFWACVRGFGDPDDEDNLATAKREMIEEIGNCSIVDSRKIGEIYQNTTFYENPVGIVFISVEESKEKNKLESGITEFRFFDINGVKKMIADSEIDDVFTMSALTKYLTMEGSL